MKQRKVPKDLTQTDYVSDARANSILQHAWETLSNVKAAEDVTGKQLKAGYVGISGLCYYRPDIDRAYELSYLASRQVEEIAMTPYMRNALLKFGDIKEGERLTVYAPVTKAELYVQRKTADKLYELYGKPVDQYDRSLNALDKKHYAVDCYRNFKTGTAMRDIQPGQQAQREEGFATFRSPAPQTPKLYTDKWIGVALRNVVNDMPSNIHASKEFHDWSGPFENKHTQTSYPFFYRDDVIVSADNTSEKAILSKYAGMTYGQMCIEIAKQCTLQDTLKLAVNMGYGRNQRGKGRPLIAMSRTGRGVQQDDTARDRSV